MTYRIHDRVQAHIGRHQIFTGRIGDIRTDAGVTTYLVQPEDNPNGPAQTAQDRQLQPAPALVYLPGDQIVATIAGNDHDGTVVSGRIDDGRDFYTVWFGDGLEIELEWAVLRPATGPGGAR